LSAISAQGGVAQGILKLINNISLMFVVVNLAILSRTIACEGKAAAAAVVAPIVCVCVCVA
jgi:hypothetical protein